MEKGNGEIWANSSMNNNRHCRIFETKVVKPIAAENKILNYILLQGGPSFEIECEQAILE